jgi:hypothetical protein
MSEEIEKEFGFLIQSEMKYGTQYLSASLIGRENGKEYPNGISSDTYGAKYALDGLTLRGFLSRWKLEEPNFLLHDPEYRDVHVDRRNVHLMAKTLDKITKRIQADGAREPGEIFLAMARALKLSFVVEKNKRSPSHGSSWSDSDWVWHDIPSGKNLFVARIRELLDEAKGATVAA